MAVLCAASIMICIQQANGFKYRLGAVVEHYVSELVLLLNLCLCTLILLPVKVSVVGRNENFQTWLVSSFCLALPVLFQSFGVYVLVFPLSLADS